MKNISDLFICFILATTIMGCSTLSKNECLQANWYELGWKDGNLGRPRSLFQEHVNVNSSNAKDDSFSNAVKSV